MYVNNTMQRLLELEEDTEIIGENFGLHYTKYAKRPLMNDLPMDYRLDLSYIYVIIYLYNLYLLFFRGGGGGVVK